MKNMGTRRDVKRETCVNQKSMIEQNFATTHQRHYFKYRPSRPRYWPIFRFLPVADTIWEIVRPYSLQQKMTDI